MKVLLINCVFGFGSTGKIVKDLKEEFEKRGNTVFVAYGRGKRMSAESFYRLASPFIMNIQSLFSKISGRTYECSPFSTYKLKRLVKSLNPDVVNIHCANANTINLSATIEFLKKEGFPTVITAHAEFYHTGGCGYALSCDKWLSECDKCPQFHTKNSTLPKSYFFSATKRQWLLLYKAYKGFTELQLTGVSSWLTHRMSCSPFFKYNTITPILNGLDTSVFHLKDSGAIRSKHNLNDKKVVLHVTPDFYYPIKGGHYVLELAHIFKRKHPNYIFIIIGYNGDGADCYDNIITVHHTQNQNELADYYSLADVCLLTSEKETFSMVTAESLCCGTPVVGFKAGAPESISIPEYSSFCEFGDMTALENTVEKFAETRFDKKKISMRAIDIYSKERMADDYLKVYHNCLKQR